MNNKELICYVEAGAVFCSNGDAAHTIDFPEDRDEIANAIKELGFYELNPNSEDFDGYADAAAKLDIFNVTSARIFTSGGYLFSPDALRD